MKLVRDAWIQGLKLRFQQQWTSYTAFELRLTGSRNCSAIGYLLGALDMLASSLPPTFAIPKYRNQSLRSEVCSKPVHAQSSRLNRDEPG